METINMSKLVQKSKMDKSLKEEYLEFFLISMAAECSKLPTEKWRENDKGEILFDVECKIDGEEVLFSEVIGHIADQVESFVVKAAKKMFLEKYHESSIKIEDAKNLLLRKLEINEEEVEW
jgi:hypothetical protein